MTFKAPKLNALIERAINLTAAARLMSRVIAPARPPAPKLKLNRKISITRDAPHRSASTSGARARWRDHLNFRLRAIFLPSRLSPRNSRLASDWTIRKILIYKRLLQFLRAAREKSRYKDPAPPVIESHIIPASEKVQARTCAQVLVWGWSRQ